MTHRVIARLDIKGPNLVKGIHLEGLRVLGKPEDFAKYYYETGVDELLYMDIVASLYNRNSLHSIISKTAKEIFIPLTVGGGLRTINDVKEVLRAGADKVSLNTAAVKSPELVKKAAGIFGSSTIAVSIEAIKHPDGKYFAYIDNGREETGLEVLEWAKKVEALGAGEIILTSVDNEGTGSGYDLELTKLVAKNVSIPVVACGGAGSLIDISRVIIESGTDAITIASMLHYGFIKKNRKIFEEDEGNVEFLKSGKTFSKITPTTIPEIKKHLKNSNIACRYTK